MRKRRLISSVKRTKIKTWKKFVSKHLTDEWQSQNQMANNASDGIDRIKCNYMHTNTNVYRADDRQVNNYNHNYLNSVHYELNMDILSIFSMLNENRSDRMNVSSVLHF